MRRDWPVNRKTHLSTDYTLLTILAELHLGKLLGEGMSLLRETFWPKPICGQGAALPPDLRKGSAFPQGRNTTIISPSRGYASANAALKGGATKRRRQSLHLLKSSEHVVHILSSAEEDMLLEPDTCLAYSLAFRQEQGLILLGSSPLFAAVGWKRAPAKHQDFGTRGKGRPSVPGSPRPARRGGTTHAPRRRILSCRNAG